MQYDSKKPYAVFLGPSLDRASAEKIFPANYYPPAGFSDVYRLLGTNCRLILLIDGVFHSSASIWPRELAAALAAGVVVVGASSLGALRALELRSFGMIGVGEIFRRFQAGGLEGDDEVALLHTMGDGEYRLISQPLVNLRHNLDRATAAGVISRNQADLLIAPIKDLYFGSRSVTALLNSEVAERELRPGQDSALEAFLTTSWEDLKRLDAIAALKFCSDQTARLSEVRGPERLPAVGQRFTELRERGILGADGTLDPISTIVQANIGTGNELAEIVVSARERFFLRRWLSASGTTVPSVWLERFQHNWHQNGSTGEIQTRNLANGLRLEEVAYEIRCRGEAAWLSERSPNELALLPVTAQALDGATEFERKSEDSIVEICLQDWALREGIVREDLATETPGLAISSLRSWLLTQGPTALGYGGEGYPQYNEEAEVMRGLQMAGQIAAWAGSS